MSDNIDNYLSEEERDSKMSDLTYHFLDTVSNSVSSFTTDVLLDFNRFDIYNFQSVMLLTLINFYKDILEEELLDGLEVMEIAATFKQDFDDIIVGMFNGDYKKYLKNEEDQDV